MPPSLVGNSMGGFVAAELALRQPQRGSQRLAARQRRRALGRGARGARQPLAGLARLSGAWDGDARWARAADSDRPRGRACARIGARHRGSSATRSGSRTQLDPRAGAPRAPAPPGFLPALEALDRLPASDDRAARGSSCPTLVVWGRPRHARPASGDAARTAVRLIGAGARREVFERHRPPRDARAPGALQPSAGGVRRRLARARGRRRGRQRLRARRHPAQRVTAPRSAPARRASRTSRRRRWCRGGGRGTYAARRVAISAAGTSRSDAAVRDVDHDPVAVRSSRDRAAERRLRGTWPTMKPQVAPEKRPSVTARRCRRARGPEAAVTPSISRMPGPPTGPSPRITTTSPGSIGRRDGVEAASSPSKTPRGACGAALMALSFTTQPSGARLPLRMPRPPRGLDRRVERRRSLPGPRSRSRPERARRASAGDGRGVLVEPPISIRRWPRGRAAGRGPCRGDDSGRPASGRRSPAWRGRSVELVDVEWSMPASRAIASRWRTRLVEPRGRGAGDGGVVEARPVIRLRALAAGEHVHRRAAGLVAASALPGWIGGTIVRAHRREAEEAQRQRHRVGGELAAAGAGAGAGGVLDRRQLLHRRCCPRPYAPTASNTSWMVTPRRRWPGMIEPP